ncbi:hypothetical protein LCGC14_0944980 [marine sediment metagenome]|uniref:Uncharacterized protein n=1 Tax=marine sediment metagenome TaxID=412755 RepID=A0A0F9R2I4_9ZZZZ
MRGPVEGGDKLKVSALDDSGPIAYPLAQIPNSVSYETVSEQPEAEPNQPLAWPLSFHGGLGYSKYNPRTAGGELGTGMVVSEPNIIRPAVAATGVTLTGAANPPNYMFEATVNDSGADDGQPVLYIIANEAAEINVYKVSLDSGDFGTLLVTKTFSVTPTQPCGKPVEWNDGSNTKWYLGLGDNSFINRLTTIVSSTAADTWTASGDADARHLKIVSNQLMRSTDENQVSVLAQGADPLTEANWGGDLFVGDVSATITALGEASGLGYIAKENGFYEWDLAGEAVNVFPEIGNTPRNGQGMLYWHGGFLIPGDNLWWTRTGKPVGPDSNPNNRANHPSLGTNNYLKHGRWHGLADIGGYIYAIYTTSNSGIGLVLQGREREETDPPGWGPIVWHAVNKIAADFDDFHGIEISETSEFSASEVRPTAWFTTGNNVRYAPLDKDGSLRSRRGDIDLYDSATFVTAGDFDFGIPRVTKQLHKIDGWAEDMKSGHLFRWRVAIDGGSLAAVGSDITTDGYFENFWTQDSSDTARSMIIELQGIITDNLTSQDGPHLRDVMVRAIAQPDVTREWTFLFAVEDEQGKTAKKIRSELEAYVGDLKKYVLPDKDTFNGVMGAPRMLRADEINRLTPRNQEPPHYVIAATVREMSAS